MSVGLSGHTPGSSWNLLGPSWGPLGQYGKLLGPSEPPGSFFWGRSGGIATADQPRAKFTGAACAAEPGGPRRRRGGRDSKCPSKR
eukprot:2107526-Pyramimonas_sp.AAC.1